MIGIIGAGLSGLTAAKILEEQGVEFCVLEGCSSVGGRVRSDREDGFIFDHGFQVLLTSYPQVKKHLNLNQLQIEAFLPGAMIYQSQGSAFAISDPLRVPQKVFETIFAPIGNLKDKLKVLGLKYASDGNEKTTMEYLQAFGLSEKMINQFFRPFFSGIFLEKDLRTRSDYFLFLYRMFSQGVASLPKEGMQAICDQLASSYRQKIHLNSQVTLIHRLESGQIKVELENKKVYIFDKVIIAVEAPALKKLLPEMNVSLKKRGVTTVYFQADSAPIKDKYLLLNGSKMGRVNHVAFLTNVQKAYAPEGKHLISVNILDQNEIDPEQIKNELNSWKLFATSDWKYLKTYKIPYAQPETFAQGKENLGQQGILVAGDFTQTPSIEGAMRSGELAAENALA